MATPAHLMQTISAATGVPLVTVVDIDRKLVTAKLRTKGGRGFHAAQMTPLDAARVLTALLGSPQANASAEAIGRYGQSRIDRARSSETLFEAAELSELVALPARHSFIDALEALIMSASIGSLARKIQETDGVWIPHIEVFAFTQATRARIRFAGLPNGLTASVDYHLGRNQPTGGRTGETAGRRGNAATSDGDFEQSRRITERTILAVATLLAGETS